ncbi:hypothetical protein EAO74_09535 [Streptomyces sp. gb1(2016)]|uniref:Uncharacterized protein n=1 Tax=Streptomyces sp. gb1(2016) TaxID=1828321 RepID=A0A652L664_9ACTN|nr:hypothetical protein EAO74_09535 [Streptomyces sp. gb1(2016)]
MPSTSRATESIRPRSGTRSWRRHGRHWPGCRAWRPNEGRRAPAGPKGCPVIPGGRTTTATAPRRVVETPEYIQYADVPPPCDAPHLTPRADPPGITGQPLARRCDRDPRPHGLARTGGP